MVGYSDEDTGDIGGNAGTGIAITSGGAINTLSLSTRGAVKGGSFGAINDSLVGYNQTAGSVGANDGHRHRDHLRNPGSAELSLSNAGDSHRRQFQQYQQQRQRCGAITRTTLGDYRGKCRHQSVGDHLRERDHRALHR